MNERPPIDPACPDPNTAPPSGGPAVLPPENDYETLADAEEEEDDDD